MYHIFTYHEILNSQKTFYFFKHTTLCPKLTIGSFNQDPSSNHYKNHTNTILTLSNNFITTVNNTLKSGENNTSDLNCIKVSDHLNSVIETIGNKHIAEILKILIELPTSNNQHLDIKKVLEQKIEKCTSLYNQSRIISPGLLLFLSKSDVDILNSLENSLSPIVKFYYTNDCPLKDWIRIMINNCKQPD